MKAFIGPYTDGDSEREIQIEAHPYDAWNADSTIAQLVVPVLELVKSTKHGAPNTDDSDVPCELASTNAQPKQNPWDIDEFHFKRWDWILDEIIWAMKEAATGYETSNSFYTTVPANTTWGYRMEIDKASLKQYEDRLANGFRLFGKYYSSLWT